MNYSENFGTPLPLGFLAAGINCGVRRYRPDLGIIISEVPAVTAGVFTQNQCRAAPIIYSQKLLPSANIRAIITNSGEANAATGLQGEADNKIMVEAAAQALECQSHQVLSASTGLIGTPLSLEKIIPGIAKLMAKTSSIAENFATAIMTTDLVPKSVYQEVQLSAGKVRVTGIAKGSGMIHPNMATMLGYILTDAQLSIEQTQNILSAITEASFNMISVDGETSTNDAVFLMANGASRVAVNNAGDLALMHKACEEIAVFLAKCIARDGEGASKLIDAKVSGLPELALARYAARSIICSPLIKTAVHGASANWGRIFARLGMTPVNPQWLNQCRITLQGHVVFENGSPTPPQLQELSVKLKQDTIYIGVDFSAGEFHANAWGCDLSAAYVHINADYPT